MSRTWRNGEREGRRERGRTPGTKDTQPTEITEEWAVRRMKRYVTAVLGRLADEGLISEADRPDYEEIVNKYIRMAVPKYDPELKSRKNGRTSTAVHYFSIVVDGIASNIRRYQEGRLRTHVPLSNACEQVAAAEGEMSVESRYLSDGSRSFRSLWLRMDYGTLVGMLTPEERRVLAMRLEGYADVEIADAMSGGDPEMRQILRFRIQRTVAKRIAAKARRCGFFPASERRGL